MLSSVELVNPKNARINSGGSRIFPRGVRQLPKLLLFFKFLPKTAWKWKNLDPQGGASLAPPLDPPMINILSFKITYKQTSHLKSPKQFKFDSIQEMQNFVSAVKTTTLL